MLPPADAADQFSQSAAFVISRSAGVGDRLPALRRQLETLGCERVLTFMPLFWRRSRNFSAPFFASGCRSQLIRQADLIREAVDLWADAAWRDEFTANLHWLLYIQWMADASCDDAYFAADLFSLEPHEVLRTAGHSMAIR